MSKESADLPVGHVAHQDKYPHDLSVAFIVWHVRDIDVPQLVALSGRDCFNVGSLPNNATSR